MQLRFGETFGFVYKILAEGSKDQSQAWKMHLQRGSICLGICQATPQIGFDLLKDGVKTGLVGHVKTGAFDI